MTSLLEDKDAIRDVLHLYCQCMDEGRFAELGILFAADGEWVAPYRTARGPAGITAWLTQSVPTSPKRMHYVMNSLIRVNGDTAEAKSNYLVMVEGPDGPIPSVCGTYVDQLVRGPNGWLFHRRALVHAFKGEMNLTLPR